MPDTKPENPNWLRQKWGTVANWKKTLVQKPFYEELGKHKILIASSAVSILLLIIFFVFEYYNVKILALDSKWILVSGIPVLIGLFVGGYIKTFKGFGVELEAKLKEPIPPSIISKVGMMDINEGMPSPKGSIQDLSALSDEYKSKIDRLRFVYGSAKDFYKIGAIDQHFVHLPNLKFIEIVNSENKFLYLLPSAALKVNSHTKNTDFIKIENFITAMENASLENAGLPLVKEYLEISDKIIEAYKTITGSFQSRILDPNKEMLPIIDEQGIMIGIVEKQKLAVKIADSVLKSID